MYYFVRDDRGNLTSVTTELDRSIPHTHYQTRHNFKTKAHADAVALEATTLTGDIFLGVDQGSHTAPRYDVVRAPKVGDKASYGFNGDSYICGEVVKISKTFKKVTTRTATGHEMHFYRRGESSSWKEGGTWSLIRGHEEKRNPHF